MFVILSEREVQPFIFSSEGVVQCFILEKKVFLYSVLVVQLGFF